MDRSPALADSVEYEVYEGLTDVPRKCFDKEGPVRR